MFFNWDLKDEAIRSVCWVVVWCWVAAVGGVPSSYATIGWGPADVIVDFGVEVEPGDFHLLVDGLDLDAPIDGEIYWKLDPTKCGLKVLREGDTDPQLQGQLLEDDRILNGLPSHAEFSQIKSVALLALTKDPCEVDGVKDEFVVIAEKAIRGIGSSFSKKPAPLGATVMVLRATAFFTPQEVTVKAGERVVWIYADGAKEPHSVTSGICESLDCQGGGKKFDSGLNMNKPGHRFAHTFRRSGTYHYYCRLHTANMRGVVIVEP